MYSVRDIYTFHTILSLKNDTATTSSRRQPAPGRSRLYLTFPNPILLEHSNERRAEAEILRAGPLAR